ncbi:MAG TPA: hypothetical protein P5572_02085 [Phycisphaerae bacterium]|nr:hypothetical protein [Phycisphaerae bacterium]
MDQYEVSSFLGYTIAVFVFASCLYRRHVRRPRLFFVGIGLFIAALLLEYLQDMVYPPTFGMALGASPTTPSSAAQVIRAAAQLALCATLPVFFAACTGGGVAYPQCSACGYDLTGNTTGTCPECGRSLRAARS